MLYKQNDQLTHIRKEAGAVLIMVLVVIVSLSLAIALATRVINQRLSTALDSKYNIEQLIESRAKAAELTYLLATQRRTVAGVSRGEIATSGGPNFDIRPIGDELRTDGFVYQEGNLKFSIQNESGLISINSPEQFWLRSYLEQQGLNRLAVQTLLDSLADFADENDRRRPAGAESFAYRGAMAQTSANALPRNYLLQSCGELHLIKGWSERRDIINSLSPLCAINRGATLNINSMPKSLLEQIFPRSVERIWQERANNKWMISESDLADKIPSINNYDPNSYSVLGGQSFQLTVSSENSERVYRERLTLYRGALVPFKKR